MLKLASEMDRARYWGLAKDWSDQQDWSFASASDRLHHEKGLAEYFANENGETVFMSNIGREYVKTRIIRA